MSYPWKKKQSQDFIIQKNLKKNWWSVYQNQSTNAVALKYGLPNTYILNNWINRYKKKLEKGAVTLTPMEKPKTKDSA